MRDAATKADNIDAMQAWAGQAARLATTEPAADLPATLGQGLLDIGSRSFEGRPRTEGYAGSVCHGGHLRMTGWTPCNYASSTTALLSTPISGTSTSTTSPGLSHLGGL